MAHYVSELESLFEPDPRKRIWFEVPLGHEATADDASTRKFLHSMADDAYNTASQIRSRGNSPAARKKARLMAKCELLRQAAIDGQFHWERAVTWTALRLWKKPTPTGSVSISNPTLSTEGSGNSD